MRPASSRSSVPTRWWSESNKSTTARKCVPGGTLAGHSRRLAVDYGRAAAPPSIIPARGGPLRRPGPRRCTARAHRPAASRDSADTTTYPPISSFDSVNGPSTTLTPLREFL